MLGDIECRGESLLVAGVRFFVVFESRFEYVPKVVDIPLAASVSQEVEKRGALIVHDGNAEEIIGNARLDAEFPLDFGNDALAVGVRYPFIEKREDAKRIQIDHGVVGFDLREPHAQVRENGFEPLDELRPLAPVTTELVGEFRVEVYPGQFSVWHNRFLSTLSGGLFIVTV